MKRQLTSILLFSALLVGGASTFVSCTDHESDSAYNTSISLADAIAKEKQALIEITNKLETKADHAADKTALEGRINENKRLIDELGEKFGDYASLDAAIAASKAYTDEKVTEASNILNVKIEELRGEDETARQQLKTALLEKITANGEAISNEEEARKQLQDNYDMAFDFLINKNLNSIAINATENPVLGYYNAAFIGSQLNLASSFYGTAAQTNQDWGIAQGALLNTGNAGEIYVSLNPTEIDPRCITSLKLVDSQGNEAKGFELGQLQNTSRVLTYGFTKAASVSSNGFYAIPVKAVDPANDDFSLNKGELKEAAKNILEKLQHPSQTNLQVSQIATTLYRSINNKLKAYTVKAEYYLWNPETMELVKKSAVAPTYNMAAFAVKPLSYNFLKDNEKLNNLDLPSFPTLQSRINFNDYKFNWTPIAGMGTMKTSITLKGMPDLDNIQIDGNVVVPVPGVGVSFAGQIVEGVLDPTTGKVTVDLSNLSPNVQVTFKDGQDKVKINKNNFKITIPQDKEQSYDVEIPMDEFNNIIDNINSQVGNMIGNVNGIVDKVNGYVETIDGKYIAGINKLITKFENVLKKSNALLQPAMFYLTSDNNWNQLARVAEGASYLKLEGGKASTVFVATSYTAELLAPAYKKCISVTKKPSGATVTGVNLGKVVNGDVQKIGFEADKEGVYELTYKAVDYSGIEASKKFYVKVVK